jgi:hypothetical protein
VVFRCMRLRSGAQILSHMSIAIIGEGCLARA